MDNYDISDMRRRILQMVRRGTIHSVQAKPPRCRVTFGTDPVSGDEHVSDWLLWRAHSDSERSDWSMPAVGSPATVLSEGGDLRNGVVFPGLITDDQIPAGTTPTEHVTRYSDGAKISYDSSTHTLEFAGVEGGIINVTAAGPITINTTNAALNADNVTAKVNNQIIASATSATVSVKSDATIISENNVSVTAKNDISVIAGQANITAEKTKINGDLEVDGNISASGDITDKNGISGSMQRLREIYDDHDHEYDDGTTGKPNQKM